MRAKGSRAIGLREKVGGRAARGAGWAALGVGVPFGLLVVGFFQWLFPNGFAGYLIGGPIATLSLAFGVMLVMAGARLGGLGDAAVWDGQRKVVEGLAARSPGGFVSAAAAAGELGIGRADADALLTRLAKERSDDWSVEISDEGTLLYGLRAAGARIAPPAEGRGTVSADGAADPASDGRASALADEWDGHAESEERVEVPRAPSPRQTGRS